MKTRPVVKVTVSPGFHYFFVKAVLKLDHWSFTFWIHVVWRMDCQKLLVHFMLKFFNEKKKIEKLLSGMMFLDLLRQFGVVKRKKKTASYDQQYFPCIHASLNREL